MPCVYQYNGPSLISIGTKTLSEDGKVEKYSYSGELSLIGKPNLVLIYQAEGLRYVDQTENFYSEESYTIVKKGNGGKYVDTVLHRTTICCTVDSDGKTLDGTYKSCVDNATITFNNTTGLRTLRFN